jgi:hypothetical protein
VRARDLLGIGGLLRVDAGRRDGDESVVGVAFDAPAVVVDEVVMVAAEQDAVVDVGGAAA